MKQNIVLDLFWNCFALFCFSCKSRLSLYSRCWRWFLRRSPQHRPVCDENLLRGAGAPPPPYPFASPSFALFYFSLFLFLFALFTFLFFHSFHFYPNSPTPFPAGRQAGRRRRPNMGLVFCVLILCYLYFLVKDAVKSAVKPQPTNQPVKDACLFLLYLV